MRVARFNCGVWSVVPEIRLKAQSLNRMFLKIVFSTLVI